MVGKKTYHKVDSMDKRNSIRIGLVGCVSCGKSTLLNSICVNQYEEMKKCRTTMLPSVYQETNNTIYSHEETSNLWTYKRDISVMNWCNENNVDFFQFPTNGIIRKLNDRNEWSRLRNERITKSIFQTPKVFKQCSQALN